ncbi:MAG: type IV pilus secretin PilQ [bacterium]
MSQESKRAVLTVRGAGALTGELFDLGEGTVALNFVNVSLAHDVEGRTDPTTAGPIRHLDVFRSLADDGRDVRVVVDVAAGAVAHLETREGEATLIVEGPQSATPEVVAQAAPPQTPAPAVQEPREPSPAVAEVRAPAQAPAASPKARSARGSAAVLSDIEGTVAKPAAETGATPVVSNESLTGFFQPPSKYVGERISIDVQEAEIQNVLRLISEISGLNLIISDQVTGRITIKLKDIPWDQVLDLVLKTKNLGKEREGNIVRIAPLEVLEKEQEARLRTQERSSKLEAVILKIIPVNFASAKDLLAKLQQVASKRDDASIDVDERTNSLIIKDTDRVVDVMTDLVHSLDTPTPQVLIEARIVEATLNFSRNLGIQWGTGYVASPETGNPTGLRFPNTVTVGGFPTGKGQTGGVQQGLTSLISGPSGNPLIVNLPAPVSTDSGGVLGLSLQSIDDTFTLDLIISALEDSGHGRLISSPRVITIDNKEAKIEQGFDIPFRTVSEEGAQVQFQEAKLQLAVTPHITPDESIVMKIKVNNDTPDFSQTVEGNPLVARKSAETEVLIRNGQTAVIGGIFQIDSDVNRSGVPWFHDIPVLGLFFRKDSEREQKNELIVFITPTIIKRAEG